MTNNQKAKAMLAIIREIHEGGRDIIGARWTLYEKMADLAEIADVAGMVQ